MEIRKEKREPVLRALQELVTGDTFMTGGSEVYLVIPHPASTKGYFCAVDLYCGTVKEFAGDAMVQPVKAVVHITEE